METVASFGDEWTRYDQSELGDTDLRRLFNGYFRIFPWDLLPDQAQGFDMGCGSGRWAKLVRSRVGLLHCIDASEEALTVARRNLADCPNVRFIHGTTDSVPLPPGSQDFGYSLGVLHHIPDTLAALRACVELLKPGAPLLLYLYYRFENRPFWFGFVWRASELLRMTISGLSPRQKQIACDVVAAIIYWPLARAARLAEQSGAPLRHLPLQAYRYMSFYTMRTDARDRFGTPLEKRFGQDEIRAMMTSAGLENIAFSDEEPYWCAVGTRKATTNT